MNSYSQDIITKKNGEDLKAKVIEVSLNDISFKKFDNTDGPTYRIPKSDVLMIRYTDGTKDIFSEAAQSSTDNMQEQGRQDALKNYTGKNSGAGWTAATSIVTSPLLGLIPALVCTAEEPDQSNLNVKNKELMKNTDYRQAYIAQAHKTKRNKIWKHYGIASGVWFVLVFVVF